MDIETIVVILAVVLLFIAGGYLYIKFTKAWIEQTIDERVDKNATPEEQEKQREQIEFEMIQSMNKSMYTPFNSGLLS